LSVQNEQTIKFFLYFPLKDDANRCCDILRRQGFSVEVRGTDADDWLVLAKGIPAGFIKNIGEVPSYLEKIAEQFGGEYDGSEMPFASAPFPN